ncbi:hypothetical protein M514_07031 [Trichuris suis]|uniref:Alpha-carbonic anhydrase domain-containing protein n=1 Tax=Trichuris suis TaxID=68888 RepID=A0A085N8T9_9BILA|nr:hypothetical protein M514_07031 [Trichuris suis]
MGEAVVSLLQELYPECKAEELKDLLRAFAAVTLNDKPLHPKTLRNECTVQQVEDKRPKNGIQQPLREDVKLLADLKCTNARRDELVSQLYRLFNENVFDKRLPYDMEVSWNPRLIKTAGFCKCRWSSKNERYCIIILSPKICTTAGRIRDTLLHEMCHAATWLIDKMAEGHGPHWRRWCQHANEVFPEIPVIRTRHSYKATTKFLYQCSTCSNRIHRHSKSIDVTKKICALCKGKFQLLKLNKATGVYESPSFWGLVNADWKMCSKGQHQSPININPTLLLYDPLLKPLTISKTRVSGKLSNTGQFLLFEIENDSKNDVTISGGPFTTYRYRLSKVIVRVGLKDQTGSEHAIDEEKFSGEVQIYGYNIDLYRNFSDAMKMPNGLAGLSAVIEIHSFTNPELKYFASVASDVMHKGRSIPFSSLSIHYLLPETSQYVTYEGSLTFPGCHESVTWLIMNKPVYINHKDLKMLRELQRSDEHASSPMYLGGGGRKLMAINRRVIRTNISFKSKSNTCRSAQRRLLYKVNPWRKLNRQSR